jgi:hypothetical protein
LKFTLRGGDIQLVKEDPITKDLEGITLKLNEFKGSLILRQENMEF